MAELVHECLEFLDGDERAEQPRVIVGDLPACEADRSLLKQVWQNLIDNAFKYSRHRQPPIIEIGCTPPARKTSRPTSCATMAPVST